MNNQIQNKLFNYQQDPDKKVWSNILDALDDQTSETSTKLFNFQQTPAPNNWNEIVVALDKKEEALIIPFYKRYNSYIKKASAVAVLIVLIFSATLLFNKKSGSIELSQQQVTSKGQPSNKNLNKEPHTPVTQISTATVDEVDNINSFKNYDNNIESAVLNYKAQKLKTVAKKPHFEPAAVLSDTRSALVNSNMLDKYIVVSAEDGKAVKLPKKIYDKLLCNDYMDYEKACKEALANLQQKIANQISATDFTGLIDILQNLQENQ